MKLKVTLKGRSNSYSAIGEYDTETKQLIVFKNSQVSATIHPFGGADTVAKARMDVIENNILTQDITFKSSSTAANFVTGSSTNGLRSWKVEDGSSLGMFIKNSVI